MQSDPQPPEDGNIAPALVAVAIAGALLTIVSPALFGRGELLSVGLGAGLAVLNLWVIARVVKSFLGGNGRSAWGPLGMLKLFGLFALVAVILKQGFAHVLPLGFGYAALPLGIVLSQLKPTSPARGEP
ncbi:MAG: hypothetical protein QM756_16900 [Polyangiaceae bacterium]